MVSARMLFVVAILFGASAMPLLSADVDPSFQVCDDMFPVLEGVGPDPLHVRCNDMCANVTAEEQDSEQAAICLDRHDHEAPNLGGIFFAQRPVDESKQLDSKYKPYMPTPSICRPDQKRTGPRCVAGGQLAPDSKRAKTLRNTLLNPLVEPVADALLFRPPFNQRVLKSITRIVHNVHPGPVPILGGGELELIKDPEKFNAYVEQSYNGNMGLVLGQEDVMPQERMANIFQNTWAASSSPTTTIRAHTHSPATTRSSALNGTEESNRFSTHCSIPSTISRNPSFGRRRCLPGECGKASGTSRCTMES